uniref:Peptidyl-prolyl cis-trans isomerase FKBP11 n=1 Tax=Gopherus agassizii TaxID=38772 RepID=A0A452I6H5_9SAUR
MPYASWVRTTATSALCTGEPRSAMLPLSPADAVLQFDVELVDLSRASHWQKLMNDVLPLLCIGLIPALLGLIGYHLYHKASSSRGAKKRLKEEKRNKAKKK